MTGFHINDRGEVDRCRAKKGGCPFDGETGLDNHYGTKEETRRAFEERMESRLIHGPLSKTVPQNFSHFDSGKGFAMDSYYGEKSPRAIQLEAMNGVVEALKESDQTQLIAACGTGKTYMGRQILNHQMEQPGSNGIAVVLTSSIKLAQDTASGMRPDDLKSDSGYDRAFGKFGEDYEVIEVHSKAVSELGRRSVLENGQVSTGRIAEQIRRAKADGKKVIIVSTYDSSKKVQEAQATLQDDRYQADVIFHDEAHNVLGQQTPTTVASGETDGVPYTGFHNSIPGSIQSRKRIYATATPVLKELPKDKDSDSTLENARATAERIMAGDQKARVTFYSDDEMIVGKIGGYISQDEAIREGCLSSPDYQIRESVISGNISDFDDPVVNSDGQLMERSDYMELNRDTGVRPLTPETYAAVQSTLQAMVEDPEDGKNGVHNVLAYTGQIANAEAFSQNFAKVAIHQSGGMTLAEAESKMDSTDSTERRRARMRLLAEYAEVRSAHSGSSKKDKEAAFTMFKGKSPTADDESRGWTPHRRALANVDIFSEGVSISEIDTVVSTDDRKSSERAMTQAVGRALRVVPGNPHKNTGHVIIPEVKDSAGHTVNSSSVSFAAYGATRVQRGVSAARVRGEAVASDETTTMRRYSSNGEDLGETKARFIAQNAVRKPTDLIDAYEIARVHENLMNRDPEYKNLKYSDQIQAIKSEVNSRSIPDANGNRSVNAQRSEGVHGRIANLSVQEMRNLRRSGKTVVNALSTGDVGALSPELSDGLMRAGLLRMRGSGEKSDLTADEKWDSVKDNFNTVARSVLLNPPSVGTRGKREEVEPSPTVKQMRAILYAEYGDSPGKNGALGKKLSKVRNEISRSERDGRPNAESEKFFNTVRSMADRSPEMRNALFEIFSDESKTQSTILRDSPAVKARRELNRDLLRRRDLKSASDGKVEYELSEDFISKENRMKGSFIRELEKYL